MLKETLRIMVHHSRHKTNTKVNKYRGEIQQLLASSQNDNNVIQG